MFASFHAAPQAMIGGCLLESKGEGERQKEEERDGWGWWEWGDARCQPPGR